MDSPHFYPSRSSDNLKPPPSPPPPPPPANKHPTQATSDLFRRNPILTKDPKLLS